MGDRPEPTVPPVVEIVWRDAFFDFTPGDRDDYLVRTVGYVCADQERPRYLAVAAELLPDDDGHRAVTYVPVALIVAIQVIRRASDW